MKLLFVGSECAPFVKTGGLADVIGAVPKALGKLGADVRVLIPAYPALAAQLASGSEVLALPKFYGGDARLVAVTAQAINLILLDAPHLFDRPGNIYLNDKGIDWADNHLRFGALSRAGAIVAQGDLPGWVPDVVHAHDWQAGLVAAFLRQGKKVKPPVVLTIHNIAFQGLFDASAMGELGLDKSLFTPDGVEYFGKLGFLKAGIALAHKITTVSPTYARELMSPEFGMGLEGLLVARQADLSGILNGIDTQVWDPENDPDLVSGYSVRTVKRKVENRAEVEARFGLDANPDAPLFCVISRLTEQKGLDLLLEVLPGLVARGARLAVLGSGDPQMEQEFIAAAKRYPGQVGAIIGYDEALSHLLQGGSDAILIPSRFEPCGLTQLYGLRYGTVPVVARTGGLADTVIDANEAALAQKCATGIQFSPVTTLALDQAIARACILFQDAKIWPAIVRNAMRHNVDWKQSASAYFELYQGLLRNPD
jgi:starch synthase